VYPNDALKDRTDEEDRPDAEETSPALVELVSCKRTSFQRCGRGL